ncbi:MAG: hypothetical protein ACT4RN_04155 [Pseudonocardia sp.]
MVGADGIQLAVEAPACGLRVVLVAGELDRATAPPLARPGDRERLLPQRVTGLLAGFSRFGSLEQALRLLGRPEPGGS